MKQTLKMVAVSVFTTVLVAFMAWGATEKLDPDGGAFARWFSKGLYVGPTKVTTTTLNRVGHIAGCVVNYDFAAMTVAAGYAQTTPPYLCVGVKLGDACSVGVAAATPADGGSAWEDQTNFDAIAKKNDYVVIKLTGDMGDGGAMNPPDAGYNVWCIGNSAQ